MRMKLCMTVLLAWLVFCGSTVAAVVPRIEVNPDGKGLKLLVFERSDHHRNYVDRGKILGDLYFNYLVDNKTYSVKLSDLQSKIRREKYRYSGNFLPESGFIRPSLSVGKRLNGILNSSTEAIIRLIFWICV